MNTDILIQSIGLGIAGLVLVLLLMPAYIRFAQKKGWVGVDIHKKEKPEVAEMGGILVIGIYLALLLVGFLLVGNDEDLSRRLLVLGLGVSIAYVVGIVDDFKNLNALAKPGFLLFASIPVLMLQTYTPRPIFPFIGETRMTIVYLLLLPFVVAVPGNSMNMLDVLNGSMVGSAIIVILAMLISLFFLPLSAIHQSILLLGGFSLLGVLLGLFFYNRYPARVFNGDTGSLSVGAALGLLAVLGRIEFIILVALIPHIANSFSILGSIKGLRERRQIRERPVIVHEDGLLEASSSPKAPLTLTRLILAAEPLRENQIVTRIWALTLVSGLLAITSSMIIGWWTL